MWNASAFGGFGGPNEQNAGGFFNASGVTPPGGSQEKKKATRMTNVVPCTIAQILRLSENEENLSVGSLTAHIVTFVGIVRNIDIQTSRVTFFIDDLSGPGIEAQIWVGENEELEKRIQGIKEDTYVRVTGVVRSMKGKRHIMAFKVYSLKETNEITMHILETIHTSMAVAVMDKEAAAMGSTLVSGTTSSFGGSTMNYGSTMSKETPSLLQGLTKAQQIVYQTLTACTNEQGMTVHDICNNVKTLSKAAVREAIDFLSNEGHIYSTIDDEHFKSTDVC